jgi:adenosylcobinamide kinase/adenosylcobinamide-phosphate guanylyltransferase
LSLSFVLVLGGARSGKSRQAEALAHRASRPVTYVATAEAWDAEMARRIAAHRERRPADWRTVDAPLELAAAVEAAAPGIVLVDCLTLWLSNVMHAGRDVGAATDAFLAAAARREAVVAVSNEVGEGIVPGTALGRAFRDEQGVLNQRVAAAATAVVKMVAGLPLVVKPRTDPEILL